MPDQDRPTHQMPIDFENPAPGDAAVVHAVKQIAKNNESFRPTPYRVGGKGPLLIGYGHAGPDVKPKQSVSKPEAERVLGKDMNRIGNRLWRFLSDTVKSAIASGSEKVKAGFAALVEVAMMGPEKLKDTHLIAAFNRGDMQKAAEHMRDFNKYNGKPNPHLTARREQDISLLNGDLHVQVAATATITPHRANFAEIKNRVDEREGYHHDPRAVLAYLPEEAQQKKMSPHPGRHHRHHRKHHRHRAEGDSPSVPV